MALISTRELITKNFDTYLVHGENTVMLYGKTPQRDGGYYIQLEYADAGGGRYGVEVAPQDLDEPMWDYDDNDC